MDPVGLYLEALDNFNPFHYQKTMKFFNRRDHRADNTDPSQAIPSIIGIGGTPPIKINLDEQLKAFSELTANPLPTFLKTLLDTHESQAGIDKTAMDQAIALVKSHFDTKMPRTPDDGNTFNIHALDRKAEAKREADVQRIADRMLSGKPLAFDLTTIAGVKDKIIANALMAAYLKTSGQIDTWVAQAKQQSSYETQVGELIGKLEEQTWLAQKIGGADVKITLDEIKQTLASHKIALIDCDANEDGKLTVEEITQQFKGILTTETRTAELQSLSQNLQPPVRRSDERSR